MENKTIKNFYNLKKYFYIAGVGILLCLIAILSTIFAVSSENNIEETNTSNVQLFTMPVSNATIYKDYSDTKFMKNNTTKVWQAHKCIDFQVASGSSVFAITDGVVKDIYTNFLEGTVVVIEHDNNITSEYGSLDSNLNVEIGDEIKKGDVVGTVSDSAKSELEAGAHLHFVMYDNDEKVDPNAYLTISNK